MTIEEFMDNLAGQLANNDSLELTPDTFIYDIEGYSSLESLFILLMIDDIYKVNLNDEDINHATTVEDLFNKIKSRM